MDHEFSAGSKRGPALLWAPFCFSGHPCLAGPTPDDGLLEFPAYFITRSRLAVGTGGLAQRSELKSFLSGLTQAPGPRSDGVLYKDLSTHFLKML